MFGRKAPIARCLEYLDAGKFRKAEKVAAKMLDVEPANEEAIMALSSVWLRTGRYYEMRRRLPGILSTARLASHPTFAYLVARACLGLRDTEAAMQWVRLAVADPHVRNQLRQDPEVEDIADPRLQRALGMEDYGYA